MKSDWDVILNMEQVCNSCSMQRYSLCRARKIAGEVGREFSLDDRRIIAAEVPDLLGIIPSDCLHPEDARAAYLKADNKEP